MLSSFGGVARNPILEEILPSLLFIKTASLLDDGLVQYMAANGRSLKKGYPIESTFATVRLRQRITKGPGSRKRGLTMAFKLIQMAQDRWRRLNAPHLLPLVRADVQLTDGVQVEREDTEERKVAA